jgi:hypothetical protein
LAGSILSVQLRWDASDLTGSENLAYSAHFGTSADPPLVASGLTEQFHDPGSLIPSTVYFWKVVAIDDRGESHAGSVWRFAARAGMWEAMVSGTGMKLSGAWVSAENDTSMAPAGAT